jgi:methanogenic corrinoid protein MtbC1
VSSAHPDTATAGLRERLDMLLAAHDRPGAVAEALRAVDSGEVDIPTLYHDVLVPAIKHVGLNWQMGRMRVWEEHAASATVRTIVESLYPRVQELKRATGPNGRSVLLACPADEQHDLGLRMLADVFDANGWDTHYLGANTPTLQIADAASVLSVDLVVLASVTLFDRLQTRHVLDDLHKRLPGVRVLVACSGEVCADTGLADDETFRAAEFFGAAHPGPAGADAESGT